MIFADDFEPTLTRRRKARRAGSQQWVYHHTDELTTEDGEGWRNKYSAHWDDERHYRQRKLGRRQRRIQGEQE